MIGSVIITAGGIGKRMGAELPKQFLLINGKPILFYSLEKFHAFDANLQLIITLPSDWIPYWNELIIIHQCQIPHKIVVGGLERFHSIQHALEQCDGEFIAIHDGVRPLVSNETIRRCFAALKHSKSVVPVIPVKDSLRFKGSDGSKMVNRNDYILVHTPQCFEANAIKKAYASAYHNGLTDDASVLESIGIHPLLVESNEENIKITTSGDLHIAEAFLQQIKAI